MIAAGQGSRVLAVKTYLKNRMIASFDRSVAHLSSVLDARLSAVTSGVARVLDVGIGDGSVAQTVRASCRNAYELYGVDAFEVGNVRALCKQFVACELEKTGLPFDDAHFDVVYSNQVIEHVVLKSFFVQECSRVLKPGGLLVLVTENVASIDNLVSMICGQEPLSQHTSEKFHSNSFMSPHFMRVYDQKDQLLGEGIHYGHKNVPSLFGLTRIVEHEGLRIESTRGFGHVADWLERMLPFQCRVILVCASKT